MKRCQRCNQHAVPFEESLCADCRFFREICTAAAILIVIGAAFIAVLR